MQSFNDGTSCDIRQVLYNSSKNFMPYYMQLCVFFIAYSQRINNNSYVFNICQLLFFSSNTILQMNFKPKGADIVKRQAITLFIAVIFLIATITGCSKENPNDTELNDESSLYTSASKIIYPDPIDGNIDAVTYETKEVHHGNDIEIILVAKGNSNEIAKFVLPYIDLVKSLNKDIDKPIVLKIYASEEHLQNNKPSWIYKDQDHKLYVL